MTTKNDDIRKLHLWMNPEQMADVEAIKRLYNQKTIAKAIRRAIRDVVENSRKNPEESK